VPKKLRKAYEQGLEYSKGDKEGFRKCYKNYPICPYSAETMLKLMTINKFIFG
jgi:TolA-binding protein